MTTKQPTKKEIEEAEKLLAVFNDPKQEFFPHNVVSIEMLKEIIESAELLGVAEGMKAGRDTKDVTRVEVIDDIGRAYINWEDDNKVELSWQDQDRTLKIFITKRTTN